MRFFSRTLLCDCCLCSFGLGLSDFAASPTNAPALALLDEMGTVSLLFTDIVMPGMTGRQLADAAQARQPALRVLYTTGYTRDAVVHNGVIGPGVAFLPKPFTVNQLAAKVSAVLNKV